jgi:hypothetical protein
MRWRTDKKTGNVPGQPATPLTDARRIPHVRVRSHVCGWCGGRMADATRRVSRARVLCHACMRSEFGGAEAYDSFIRTERARTREREKKQRCLTQVK